MQRGDSAGAMSPTGEIEEAAELEVLVEEEKNQKRDQVIQEYVFSSVSWILRGLARVAGCGE